MSFATAELPTDPDALRAFAAALQSALYAKTLHVEKLKAQWRRCAAPALANPRRSSTDRSIGLNRRTKRDRRPRRRARDHLFARRGCEIAARCRIICPRETVAHAGACVCPACGSARLSKIGDDDREVLEYVPSHFKVVVHVRPKLSCRDCESIAQPPMPSLPIERGRPGPG